MSQDLRDVLTRVAAGELTPAEAATLLDDPDLSPPAARPSPAAADAPATVLELRSEGAKLTVIADPTVAEAVAEGPHTFVRDGNVLRLTTGRTAETDGFRVEQGTPRWLAWIPKSFEATTRVRVRVNPNIAIKLDALASAVIVSGLRAPFSGRINAGKLTLGDHEGTVDVSVTMAQFDALVTLADGNSRIVADVAGVDLRLREGSNVRVLAQAEMGSVDLLAGSGKESYSATRSANGISMHDMAVVGSGAGELHIETRMGHATVRLP